MPRIPLTDDAIAQLRDIIVLYLDRLSPAVYDAAINMLMTGEADGIPWDHWAFDDYMTDHNPYPVTDIAHIRTFGRPLTAAY